jgi:acyl dehydratase
MEAMYFEDVEVGYTSSGAETITVTEADIVAFATQFDPQPFHTDAVAARQSVFGQLVASGWHTASMTMRMIVDRRPQFAGGIIGMGLESIQWPRPVLPGDQLTVLGEVLDMRTSNSRPNHGVIKIRNTTLNQRGEAVQIMVSNLLVPRRVAQNE